MTSSSARCAAHLCGALLLAVFLYAGCSALRLSASEDVYSHRGTFAFWVTIDEPVIARFPTPGLVGSPTFHSGCGDGPKAPDRSISFRTRLAREALLTRVKRHVLAHGFVAVPPHDGEIAAFESGTKTLLVHIENVGPGVSQVDAELLHPFE